MTPYEVEIFINTSHFLGRNLINQVFFDSYLNVNIGMLKTLKHHLPPALTD